MSQSAIWSLGFVSISFESYVYMAYWLGAFTFVALFPYMANIIGLLKSENIIKRLAIGITKAKILNPKEDPILPIVAIILGSIMKYDFETTRFGLKAVTDHFIEIIDSDSEDETSKRFCESLRQVGGIALSKMDEKSTLDVILNFQNFGKSAAEKGLEKVTSQVVWSLGAVGKVAVEKGLEYVTEMAAWSLAELTISSEENVKTAIQYYKSVILEKQDRNSFDKFMEIYEQVLEKRRDEKRTLNNKKTKSK